MNLAADDVTSLARGVLRAQGKARVRRRLEALVNSDMLGIAGAQKLYFECFGDRLVARTLTVPQEAPRSWFSRLWR